MYYLKEEYRGGSYKDSISDYDYDNLSYTTQQRYERSRSISNDIVDTAIDVAIGFGLSQMFSNDNDNSSSSYDSSSSDSSSTDFGEGDFGGGGASSDW